jgi:hypothetical protein
MIAASGMPQRLRLGGLTVHAVDLRGRQLPCFFFFGLPTLLAISTLFNSFFSRTKRVS